MLETGQSSAAGGLGWPNVGNQNAVTALWLLLKECPDVAFSESLSTLTFLEDEAFRLNVQLDISSAEADFNNGEWKPATVMAGAALEALLLWAVSRYSEDERLAALRRLGLGKLKEAQPETWRLDDYITVAGGLGVISEETNDAGWAYPGL
jgi:hypothetical protein